MIVHIQTSDEGLDFAKEILQFIERKADEGVRVRVETVLNLALLACSSEADLYN